MDKEKSNKNRLGIILAIVVLLLIVVIVVLVVALLKKDNDTASSNGDVQQSQTADVSQSNQADQAPVLSYEENVVATDEDTLQKMVDEMVAKAEEGTMALEMKTDAISTNGTDFKCYIANAINNKYDMFVVIYLDDTQEEIYRSGLIPLGSRIESFTSSTKLEPGSYVGTIVYNQVEDDRATIHSQVNVGLNLIVN